MNSTFEAMKNSRKNSLDVLTDKITKMQAGNTSTQKREEDDRFWQPTADKTGTGSATIRFLPAPEGEDEPMVRIFDHGFQGPTGKWYIENSLTTIGLKDPVGEDNSRLWKSGSESDKEIARQRKRRLSYISNILVINDPAVPENNGKVFCYKYGKKIFDKIVAQMHPDEDDVAQGLAKKINPFDLWEGANFKIKFAKVSGYRNYDESKFFAPTPVSDDESVIERIWKSEFPLQQFISPDKFKSWDELSKHFNEVWNDAGTPMHRAERAIEATISGPNTMEANAGKTLRDPVPSPSVDDDDEDALAVFRRLADED